MQNNLCNPISLALVGDISLNGLFSLEPEKNKLRLTEVSQLLSEYSLVLANLEMPVETNERNENKNHHHYINPLVARQVLKMLNISCVSLANNHIFDCKHSGVKETIGILDSLGVKHTGAGWLDEHLAPILFEKDGVKVAFLAYVDNGTNPQINGFDDFKLNFFNVDKVKSDITSVKSMADLIICSIHWGTDYSNFYTKQQQQQAHELIDAGADIIMGHHPHTIQPVELYNNKYIFYSLGGICFGDFYKKGRLTAIKRKTKLGLIATKKTNENEFLYYPTKEQKGNKIVITKLNIKRKLLRLSRLNYLKNKYKIINILISFKESVIDRLLEFFFGYYRNPLKQIIEFRWVGKIGYIFRDFKKVKQ